MNPELIQALADCTETVNRLLDLLEQDWADMSACVNGEILAVYRQGTEAARQAAEGIRTDLLRLQAAQLG